MSQPVNDPNPTAIPVDAASPIKNKKNNHKRKSRWRGRKRTSPPGAPPGSILVDPQSLPTSIQVLSFHDEHFTLRENVSIVDLSRLLRSSSLCWIDVTGLGTHSTLKSLAEILGIHPLAMEDVLNVNQRAKVDQFGDSLFVVARMIDHQDARDSEQISFVVKPGAIVSFQQRPGDCWGPLRTRLMEGRGTLREIGSDYLLYMLLDAIIDSYYPFIDALADELDQIDEAITHQAEHDGFERLHFLRSQLLSLRRIIRPHREMVNQLIRDEYPIISANTKLFLRDCYDHVIHVLDSAETYNEAANGVRDFHMSVVSNRMNEIMKVLTIMSTIFIPLSFVSGVYGMNFNTELPGNMPELNWPYAYVAVVIFMASVALGLLGFFRYRRWI